MPLPCVALGATAPEQGIAAVVNDDVISVHDLDTRIALVLATSNLADTPENRRRLAPEVLRTLIDGTLKRQEMRKQGVSVPQSDIDRALTQIASQVNIQPGQLADYLQAHGVHMSTLIDQLEVEIGWMKAISRIAGDRANVSAEEVDEEMARLSAGSADVQYHLSEIFLPLDDSADQDTVEETAQRLVAEARGGANFAALARTFSQGPAAANGGDLGWVARNQLDTPIQTVVATLRPGEISDPIRAQGGYFILAMAGQRAGASAGKTVLSLQQIFLALPRSASDAEVSAAALAARNVGLGVKDCSDFAARAKAAPGIASNSIPAIEPQTMPPELQQIIAPMQPGDVTTPLRTPDGFLVVMLCDRQEQESAVEDRQAVERRLHEQKLSATARRLLRDLRRSALLDVRM